MTDTSSRKIVYKGPSELFSGLVEWLEEEGVQVETSSPYRDGNGAHVLYDLGSMLGNDANLVIVELVATGSAAAIIAGVKKFKAWHVYRELTKVEMEGDDEEIVSDIVPIEDDDADEPEGRMEFGVQLEDGTFMECADEEQAIASAKEAGGLVVMRQVFETPWQVTDVYTRDEGVGWATPR
jgi:hypothetical protein